MVDWRTSQLVMLICGDIIVTAIMLGSILICHSSSSGITFAFMSSEVRRLLFVFGPLW